MARLAIWQLRGEWSTLAGIVRMACEIIGRRTGRGSAAKKEKRTRNQRWSRVPVSIRVESRESRVESQQTAADFWLSTLDSRLSTLQVGSTGFEPAHPFGHKALNLARLPISPRARGQQDSAKTWRIRQSTRPVAERQATARRGCWRRRRELDYRGSPASRGCDFSLMHVSVPLRCRENHATHATACDGSLLRCRRHRRSTPPRR